MFTKVLLLTLLGVGLVLAAPVPKLELKDIILEKIENAENDIAEWVHQFANFDKDVVRKIEEVKDDTFAKLKALKDSASKGILGVPVKIYKILKNAKEMISELVAPKPGEAIEDAENKVVELVNQLGVIHKGKVQKMEEVKNKALPKLDNLKHSAKPLKDIESDISKITKDVGKSISELVTSKPGKWLSTKAITRIEEVENKIVEFVHQFAEDSKHLVRKIEQLVKPRLLELKDLKDSAMEDPIGVWFKIPSIPVLIKKFLWDLATPV